MFLFWTSFLTNFKNNKYTLLVNDEILSESIDIAKGKLKEETLHFKKGINKVEIRLNNTTCPKDEGMSEDTRNLGLLIKLNKTN